jgi:hypothetical protein
MTCRTCIHRLDVTLWGCWLATGCRLGLALRRGCDSCAPTDPATYRGSGAGQKSAPSKMETGGTAEQR